MKIYGEEIQQVAVLGMGMTGRSCARFLLAQGLDVTLLDTREQLDARAISDEFQQAPVILSPLERIDFSGYQMVVVSPGLAIDHPALLTAKNQGCHLIGDIELFAHFVSVPVVAITGSNGKTTVTSLLTQMAKEAGVNAIAVGNIGVPVLDHVLDNSVELFILELSSFQLETTHSLALEAATVLNISDDHMDRYESLDEYAKAKQRIYTHCKTPIFNRQDKLTLPNKLDVNAISFGDDEPSSSQAFGLADGCLLRGDTVLFKAQQMAMLGRHNQLNALAALALGQQIGLPFESMLTTLSTFSGLAHRCQKVLTDDGIIWLNDSKATNVGATLAALQGLESLRGQLIVIAGGDAKGGDLTPLKQPFANRVSHLLVMGADAHLFEAIYPQAQRCQSMSDAVKRAAKLAKNGDTVLLSPACASIDMFDNYMQRGEHFMTAIGQLHAP